VVNYYKTLHIQKNATASEIKSAYRRLARERHPDLNGGSEAAAREFALISLAYRTLSDPQERAYYDSRLARGSESSILSSNNPHARRMRNMAAQVRWDRAVDLCLEAERQETFARTQAVFTTVSLFLSTFIVAMLKPRFWQSFDGYTGRAVLILLFVVGLWHLGSRLRDYFDRYTYRPKIIQDSIIKGEDLPDKPFTRSTAAAFLCLGSMACLAAGLFVGVHTYYIVEDLAFFFDQQVRLDMLFYPPIAVLIIDTMHAIASKID
jgi:hypothetical protein